MAAEPLTAGLGGGDAGLDALANKVPLELGASPRRSSCRPASCLIGSRTRTSAARAHLGLNKGEARKRWPVPSISVGSARSATAALRTSSSRLRAQPVGRGHHPLEHEVPGGGLHELRRQGGTINEDLLRHVAPLGWERIGLTGDYAWEHCRSAPAFGLTATTIAYLLPSIRRPDADVLDLLSWRIQAALSDTQSSIPTGPFSLLEPGHGSDCSLLAAAGPPTGGVARPAHTLHVNDPAERHQLQIPR